MRASMVARALPWVVLGMLVVVATAGARRPATAPETRVLRAAIERTQGTQLAVRIRRAFLSTVDSDFASVTWTQGPAPAAVSLLQRVKSRWVTIWGRRLGEKADGACAFAPAAVVTDLYSIRCPAWADLHARRATPAEAAQLERAVNGSAFTKIYAKSMQLVHICVSRRDPRYAAAEMAFHSTAGFVWFRGTTTWSVRFESVARRGTLPPPAIVLSLASCVGYNAAEYGG